MKRLPSLILVLCLAILCTSCGNIFVRGAIQPGFSSITGFVSIVQISAVIGGNGTTVQVTIVTFLQDGMSSTINFCGDQSNQFPLNQNVRVDFTPGQTCGNIIIVVII